MSSFFRVLDLTNDFWSTSCDIQFGIFSGMTRWLAFHGREVKVCWCIGCFAWSSWGTSEFGCRGPKPSKCWGVFTLTLLMFFDIFWSDFCESHHYFSSLAKRRALLILIALKDAAAGAQLCADKITALPNDATVPWLPPELLAHSYCWYHCYPILFHSRMSSTPKFREAFLAC